MPLRMGSRPVSSAARLGVQTAGRDVEVREAHALGGHAVEVGRADARMAVAAQVAVAQIVGEDDDDVGQLFGPHGAGDGDGERNDCNEEEVQRMFTHIHICRCHLLLRPAHLARGESAARFDGTCCRQSTFNPAPTLRRRKPNVESNWMRTARSEEAGNPWDVEGSGRASVPARAHDGPEPATRGPNSRRGHIVASRDATSSS